jgi:hypothetical protein
MFELKQRGRWRFGFFFFFLLSENKICGRETMIEIFIYTEKREERPDQMM